jgi:hypothetical protein
MLEFLASASGGFLNANLQEYPRPPDLIGYARIGADYDGTWIAVLSQLFGIF